MISMRANDGGTSRNRAHVVARIYFITRVVIAGLLAATGVRGESETGKSFSAIKAAGAVGPEDLLVSSGTEIMRVTPAGDILSFGGNPGCASVREEEIFLFNMFARRVDVYSRSGGLLRSIKISPEVYAFNGFQVLPDKRMAFFDNRKDVVHFSDGAGRHLRTVKFLDVPDHHAQNMKAVVAGNRSLIISENGHKQIIAIDLGTYEVHIFRDLGKLPGPWLGAIAYEKERFYVCDPTKVYAFDETSDTIKEIAEVPERNIVGIAAARGRLFVVVNSERGSLYEVDPISGKVSLLKTGLKSPSGLTSVGPY